MRNYRNVIAALVLALALAAPALADGIMNTDKTPPPPPPSATGIMNTDLTGGIMYPEAVESAPVVTDSATEIALNLLQTALTLF
jgi:hypothetical protein